MPWFPCVSLALSCSCTGSLACNYSEQPLRGSCVPRVTLTFVVPPTIAGRLMCGRCAGLRLHWCTPNFELDSALVAVKFFQPSADLITQGAQLSNVLAIWVEEVMGEFALDMKDLFCTVTDAGSDVNRLNLKVSTSEWEWCFRQMLSCVLVEVRVTHDTYLRRRQHVGCFGAHLLLHVVLVRGERRVNVTPHAHVHATFACACLHVLLCLCSHALVLTGVRNDRFARSLQES